MDSETELKPRILKHHFVKKDKREDGLILKVHHTTPGPTGDIRRTRFIHATFSCCDELLAAADHRGNIFVIDLANNVCWLLGKQPSVSLLSFHPHRREDLLVGTKECSLLFLNAETGYKLGSFRGHTAAPMFASFTSDGLFCLSVASSEGFIWDAKTFTQAHRLNLQNGMKIKNAYFMPVSDNILACFEDDAIHVWAFPSFQCIKQIVPDTWKGQSVRSIAFTRNGSAMVLGGISRQLVVFTVDDLDAQRVMHLPDDVSGVLHIEFLPQPFDSGANEILMVLTDTGSFLFYNLATETVVKARDETNIHSFTCSKSGKYVVCKTTDGEIKIFSGSQLLANTMKSAGITFHVPKEEPLELKVIPPPETITIPKVNATKRSGSSSKHHIKINQQIEAALDLNRLVPILKEFSMYPDQYRGLIWRSILQLPGNKEPWNSLSQRPLHPAAQVLSTTNLIQNKTMFDCLQNVVSCLAYWSPVFGDIPYLPHFIFPFIKVLHSDKFVCFEVSVTLIVNWCQHWFEYCSFPPINVLGMIENVLSEHDNDLMLKFCDSSVTSRQYAWPLLSTAFSEVLTSDQWKQLWDHVLSNPPWFLLFAVVAYNICCRASLKTCSSKKDFQFFFSNQNPVNMKYFIKKSYELMEKTSPENHPSQHLNTFTPLPKGNYPVFSDYPKYIVNYQKEQRSAIQREEENILKEQQLILSQRLACEERLLRERRARIHEARLLEAEKSASAALQAEEAKLVGKRKQLSALRRELRAQEEESLAAARVEAMEHQVKQRSAELGRLHHHLHVQAEQSGLDRHDLQEEVQDHVSRLNARKQELKERLDEYRLHELARPIIDRIAPGDEISQLKHQQQRLSDEIRKLREKSRNEGVQAFNVDIEMAEFENIQQRVEVALARKALVDQGVQVNAELCLEEAYSAAKLKKLEKEVSDLAHKLSSIRNPDDPHDRCKSDMSERLLSSLKEPVICFEPTETAEAFSLRSSEFARKENNAVSSAMELRKSLLTGWNSNSR